ncbi:SET domain-containing protein [Aquincola sp. S2]|uniref:SET domain-containing protein n=1 Tax=Pseudaquabacterium terrae TaxID=2732868 RepID=A0ABX2EGV8_9BURK|nr:SET domain-containing protein [Aquabacterium terrae]NRF67822.1 SET domain-containing protein [Aquabacterium terrae]
MNDHAHPQQPAPPSSERFSAPRIHEVRPSLPLDDYARCKLDEADARLQHIVGELNSGLHHRAVAMYEMREVAGLIDQIWLPEHRSLVRAAGAMKPPPEAPTGSNNSVDWDVTLAMAATICRKAEQGEGLDEHEEAVSRMIAFISTASMVLEVKQRWIRQLEAEAHVYDPSNNGRYPYRDVHGLPLRIVALHPLSECSQSGRRYGSEAVLPFVRCTRPDDAGAEVAISAAERSALYDALACVPFAAEHLRRPHEAAMIGLHNTVVATRALPAGTCIGVCGGPVIGSELGDWRAVVSYSLFAWLLQDEHRLIDFQNVDVNDCELVTIQGDNIVSRINSIFDDENGLPVRQAAEGYNVEAAWFRGRLDDGRCLAFTAFFTQQDIGPGEELRWDYWYSEEMVRHSIAEPILASSRPGRQDDSAERTAGSGHGAV